MTRQDLIAALAARFPHLSREDAGAAAVLILDALGTALVEGKRIEVRGFGSFTLHFRPARDGRNPRSGATVRIPGRYAPRFKPAKGLLEQVGRRAVEGD